MIRVPLPRFAVALVGLAMTVGSGWAQDTTRPRNVVLIVPDGLRAGIVRADTAPTMAALRDKGVNFRNSHSVFPTFTMPNASAMATGHSLGDTGVFSNTIYSGFPVPTANSSLTPFIENDPVLGDIDEHYMGDFLDEETVMKAARDAGYNTAAIGKVGPALIFDHTARDGTKTVLLDDMTGTANGIRLAPWLLDALQSASLPTHTPARGDNGQAGTASVAGTKSANVLQQAWFADVLTRVVLPKFKADDKPFFVVFWSRDPDGTQHYQGDSLLKLVPGINGPTSMAAIRNVDNNVAQIRQALADLGLADSTNVIVSADHGFSTISKESDTSPAAKMTIDGTPAGLLPGGFVALDLAKTLGLTLFDPDQKSAKVAEGQRTRFANGLIGNDPAKPDVVVAANGGSDLVYLPQGDKAMAGKVIDFLLSQDYVSGLFVDETLGTFPGTLPLSAINLRGTALTPMPAIVVNFKSFSTGCADAPLCTVEVADSTLQQGQGMHGSFSRGDTWNFQAAIGPDFKAGYVDAAPSSNADIGQTIAALMRLSPKSKGALIGRPLTEAMPNGAEPEHRAGSLVSAAARNGLVTVLNYQTANGVRYFDAAGFPGRTVGLSNGQP
ncbi:nucleotide pyrophosphatase/phosphodiesterase family protein [Lichenihabitans psoromatis]|uniref:nucleotide pyrophosphatase/phosphodiesterase family protein n=1 Tax=Lichenihabitans psoromatis TaxID=2528642 RepID=UPI0010384475|nr:nucleotide pyrophosphatase/phosphodiesterase family protein [Lichenihabitans psoromatis]